MACYNIPHLQVHAFWRTFYCKGKNFAVTNRVCYKLITLGCPRTYSASSLFQKDVSEGCCRLNSRFNKVVSPISSSGISSSAQNAETQSQTTVVDSPAITSPSNGRVMLIDGTSIIYRAYCKLLGGF